MSDSEVTFNDRPVAVEEKDAEPSAIESSSKRQFINPESDSAKDDIDIYIKADDTQEPFVGWLVCLNDNGTPEYRIFAGENYIVRNEDSYKLLQQRHHI